MANSIRIKRTTTSGLLPNVSNSSNTSYIAAGELAINLTDRKLLSSNGSATFEIGANLATIVVGTAFTQTSGNANFDSGVLFVDGTNNRVGVNNTTPAHALSITGTLFAGNTTINGDLAIGGVDAGPNFISFRGTTGDSPNSYNHTYIGERIHTASEASELFLFKGNDPLSSAGPDRVRIGAAEFRVDTYTSELSGTFETVASSANLTNRFIITNAGNVGIGNSTPSSKLVVAGAVELGNTTVTGFANVTTTATIGTGFTLTSGTNNRVGIGNTTPAHALSVTGTTNLGGAVTGITTLAAGNTTVTGFVSANNAYANGTTGQSFRATTPGVAQGEKSALTMYATFTGSGDNGPRRVADIVGGYIGGTWGNETLTFHVGIGGQNDNANTTTQRLLVNTTSFAANNLAFSGITTLAAGNTSITGFITATGDITAFFSDDRLKDRYSNIPNAVEKVKSLNGFYYEPNITAQDLGYQKEMHVGVSAQEVNAIMPEIVAPAPIDNKYLTVKYDRLVPLLIEAIKEQQTQIDELKAQLNKD